MDWIRKFMWGRYGLDGFSKFIMVLALILAFLGMVFNSHSFTFIANILMVYFIFRTLSKNLGRRQHENNLFMNVAAPILGKHNSIKKRLLEGKSFKYFKCPNCKQELRVPRGKGEITITCPKCKEKFNKKS